MKTIASLICAISLSLGLISPVAANDWKETLVALPAVPHTTLDSSLAVVSAGVSLDFGVPDIVMRKDLNETLLALPAVPHTTLDSSLAAIGPGFSVDFGAPATVEREDLTPGTNMKVSGVVSTRPDCCKDSLGAEDPDSL